MPFLNKITSFCPKSSINRLTEIAQLLHKDSSRQGAHITCQKNKKIWHHVDNEENLKIVGIFF
jgi:hypothetical protein